VQQHEEQATRVGVFRMRPQALLAIRNISWTRKATQRTEWVIPGPGSGTIYVDKKTLFGGVNYHADVTYHYPKKEIAAFVATAISRAAEQDKSSVRAGARR